MAAASGPPHSPGDERATVRVDDDPMQSRYEAWIGDQLAGFIVYRRVPGRITFLHTETDPTFRGHGVATRLATAVLDDARAHGWTVIARCPFIAEFIRQHPEYADLLTAAPSPGRTPR